MPYSLANIGHFAGILHTHRLSAAAIVSDRQDHRADLLCAVFFDHNTKLSWCPYSL